MKALLLVGVRGHVDYCGMLPAVKSLGAWLHSSSSSRGRTPDASRGVFHVHAGACLAPSNPCPTFCRACPHACPSTRYLRSQQLRSPCHAVPGQPPQIGGRMAFTLLAAQGVSVGSTQIEPDWLEVGACCAVPCCAVLCSAAVPDPQRASRARASARRHRRRMTHSKLLPPATDPPAHPQTRATCGVSRP